MKEVVYLHGLESKTNCSKVKYLRELGYKVHNPSMNYKNDSCFKKTKELLKKNNPKVIIGSSMGGYFAYELGKHFNIPVILLNPALHSRNFEPNIDNGGENQPIVYLAVGENDDMIDYKKTIKYLLKNSKKFTNDNYLKGNHGHRTPIEVLEQILLKFNLPYL